MDIDLFRYRLPLTSPIVLRHTTLTERTGYLIRLRDDRMEGWGEASPLLGFSRETDEDVLLSLTAIRKSGDPGRLEAAPSSVRFAVESALLELQAQREGKSMAEVLNADCARQIDLNALVTSAADQAMFEMRQHLEKGYTTLKLKIGRESLENDIATVQGIQKELSETVHLRLDANQVWSYDEAIAFARNVDAVAISYVEEPLAEPERLREFVESTHMAVALDESLVGMEPSDLAGHGYAKVIILKPSIGGGLNWARRMATKANELNMIPVISNALECGVGLRAHVALVAALTPAAAGLNTYQRFADDVYNERLPMDSPIIDVANALAPRTPDLDKLELIP